jgi:hypothetical protein
VIWPLATELEVPDLVRLPTTWLPENPDADECRCGRPTRDQAYVCDHCADLLAQALGDIPWAVEQLDISITGQRAASTNGGSASADHGLPWHERAATAKRTLHGLLASWVRWCREEQIRNSDPHGDDWPDDNPVSMSRWLLWRVDGLALHDTGPEAVEQITDALAECRRIVLWKRRGRIFLGRCDDQPVCMGEVWADEGRDVGICDGCERGYPVAERRQSIEQQLDDRLYTAVEIARLTTFLGLDVPRERVRNQINTWERRGRITARSTGSEGQPLYRYGDIKPLLYAQYAHADATA